MDSRRWNAPALLYAAVIVFTFLMMLAAVPVGFYTVFFLHLSDEYSSQTHTGGLPIDVGLASFRIVQLNPSYGVLFTVLTLVIVALVVLAAVQGGGFIRSLRDSATQGFWAVFRNPLSGTIVILGATLFATNLLQDAQTAVGIQTGGLSGDPLELLVSFVLAPFIEEIGYRFFLIGVPLFIVLVITKSSLTRSLRALWRPSAAWEGKADDPISDSHKLLVYLLVAFSSVLFGVAHYLAGSGWQIGKISEAALDGLALGYLYVRYGLHTSIIFHWVVDFASESFAFYGQAAYGISWTSNSVFTAIPTNDIVYLLGIPALFYLIFRFIMKVVNLERSTPRVGESVQAQAS